MRHHPFASQSKRRTSTLTLLVLTAGLLGGCETDGMPPSPLTELAAYGSRAQEPAAQRPRRAQVAMDCWALAEKSHAGATLDAKADFVNKCIDAKMGTPDTQADAKADAKSEGKSDAKRDAKPSAAVKPKQKPKQDGEAKPAS